MASIRLTRTASLALPVVLILAGAAGPWLAAHEGHGTVHRPIYREVRVGTSDYRVGFAAVPEDPLVGEDIRFEFQILRKTTDASPDQPVTPTTPLVRISPLDTQQADTAEAAAVGPGEKPGTFMARYRFEDRGQYSISARAGVGTDSVAAEFPLLVRGGPVAFTPIVLDGVLLLLVVGLVLARLRVSREPDAARRTTARAAVTLAGFAAVLAAAHFWIGPALGGLLLPERHVGSVAWDVPVPGDPGSGSMPHSHPPGTPPHTHSDETAPDSTVADRAGSGERPGAVDDFPFQVASTVVPVPGQLAEVVVPVTSRVLFEDFVPQMGRRVRRGQTIAILEHRYVMHDANHLINERWPFFLRALETRRAALAAELNLARVRHVRDRAEPAVRELLTVMQALPQAERDAAEARVNRERAEKLLAMHDAQINRSAPVRRPLTSPIDGTIEAVHFTQGELKYESDKLFTILDLSRVWIEARFPERFASERLPRRMTFISPAYPGVSYEGRLARVANALDPATRTVSAFFEVANPQRSLRVGMRLTGRRSGREDGFPPAADGSAVPASLPTDAALPEVLTLPATVRPQPALTAEVTAPLWGRIEFAGRRLNVGDRVRKGEDLLQVVLELSVDERYPMESRALDIDSERDLAKTRVEQAKRAYEQALALFKQTPDDEFRRAEVDLTEQILREAEVQETLLVRQAEAFRGVMKRRDPRITTIQAPISGVVSEIGFRPGELNRTGEFRRLLTIVDPSRVWLEAQVYENQSAALLSGVAKATFTAPGLPSARPLGRPVAVSGALDPGTGTLTVIFDVPNPGGALKIGASAEIAVSRN